MTEIKKLGFLCIVFGLLFGASIAGEKGFIPEGYFPKLKSFIPDLPGLPDFKSHATEEQKAPAEKSPSANSPPDTSKPAFFVNSEALTPFYKSLRESDKRVVRIIHFGDSILWGDNLTYRMKAHFQKDYGDGGRGLLSVVDTSDTVLKGHMNRTNPAAFSMHSVPYKFVTETLSELGFTGKGFIPKSNDSRASFQIPKDGGLPWKQMQIIARQRANAEASATAYFKTESGKAESVTEKISKKCDSVQIDLPSVKEVEIGFTGAPNIDSVILENDRGVSYSPVVRMGIHQSWMMSISDDAFSCGMAFAKPDLIIYQFGLNESASLETFFGGFTQEMYVKLLNEYYDRLKKALPNTPVLVIGPMDRFKSPDTPLLAAQIQIRDIQRKVAAQHGYAFYDLAARLGPGHVTNFYLKGYFLSDYMHISVPGGDFLADTLYEDLNKANPWRKTNDSQALQTSGDIDTNPSADGNRTITFHSARYGWFLFFVVLMTSLLRSYPSARMILLMICSLYFYASWRFWALGFLLFTAIVDYLCALGIEKARSGSGKIGRYLLISLVSNLGILFFFKYYNFFATTVTQTGITGLPVLHLILPIGISFYTFQSLSYTIDVYRGQLPAEKSVFRFLFFVSLFPQLVAGPIVRAKEFLPAIRKDIRHFLPDQRHFQSGVFLVLKGLTKKIFADYLAVNCIDGVYQNPSMFSSLEITAAFYAYALQLYGDFSGYTDMATGSARMLGFNLTRNFHRPHQSASITEFWRRWHISLGTWFRDYVYIPLGGSRKGPYRIYFNLLLTMGIAGLWHGAGWNFIIWGFMFGIFLCFERLTGLDKPPRNIWTRIPRVFVTVHLVLFCWILFRVTSIDTFWTILHQFAKFNWTSVNLHTGSIVVILVGFAIHFTPFSWMARLRTRFAMSPWVAGASVSAIVILLLNKVAVVQAVPFIYFQF